MNERKILVPVDFSDSTVDVIGFASKLASEWEAQLCIIHVDEMHASSSALGEDHFVYIPRGCPVADEDRPSRLEQVQPTLTEIKCEHRELAGEPVEEIVAFAIQEQVDMIVMGSHGRTGLSRLLMGSVAEGVVRHAPCPVLIVKSPPYEKSMVSARNTSKRRQPLSGIFCGQPAGEL